MAHALTHEFASGVGLWYSLVHPEVPNDPDTAMEAVIRRLSRTRLPGSWFAAAPRADTGSVAERREVHT